MRPLSKLCVLCRPLEWQWRSPIRSFHNSSVGRSLRREAQSGYNSHRCRWAGTGHRQHPENGSQYFLSNADVDSLQGDLESTAVRWKMLALVLALLWVGRRYYQHQELHWEWEQERREYERLQAEAPRTRNAAGGLEDPLDEAGEHREFLFDLPQSATTVFCWIVGICCCHSCYQALPQRLCPIADRPSAEYCLYYT